jgi:hypothetical protein
MLTIRGYDNNVVSRLPIVRLASAPQRLIGGTYVLGALSILGAAVGAFAADAPIVTAPLSFLGFLFACDFPKFWRPL